jgi:hypothetical protein
MCRCSTGASSKKATEKRKHIKGSSCSRDETSTQVLALAKPLKPSKKFSSQSSRPSIIEKTSSANLKISGGKTFSTSMGWGGSGRAPARTLDLFDSGLSASSGEDAAPVPRRKRP